MEILMVRESDKKYSIRYEEVLEEKNERPHKLYFSRVMLEEEFGGKIPQQIIVTVQEKKG